MLTFTYIIIENNLKNNMCVLRTNYCGSSKPNYEVKSVQPEPKYAYTKTISEI